MDLLVAMQIQAWPIEKYILSNGCKLSFFLCFTCQLIKDHVPTDGITFIVASKFCHNFTNFCYQCFTYYRKSFQMFFFINKSSFKCVGIYICLHYVLKFKNKEAQKFYSYWLKAVRDFCLQLHQRAVYKRESRSNICCLRF